MEFSFQKENISRDYFQFISGGEFKDTFRTGIALNN